VIFCKELKKKKLDTTHKKVARLLRENGLNYRMKKKLKITTDSKHKYQSAQNILFEYIEIFYSRQRSHSFLGYNTPVGYESNSVA